MARGRHPRQYALAGARAAAPALEAAQRTLRQPVLHYRALDPFVGHVPACWDGSRSFISAALTPDSRFVECSRCRQWLENCEEHNG